MLTEPPPAPRRLPWILLFLLISLAVCVAGYVAYEKELQDILRTKHELLTAVGELKSEQIQQWRRERIGDAAVRAAESPYFRDSLRALIELPEAETEQLRHAWRVRMEIIRTAYRYSDVVVVDTDGRTVLSVLEEPDPIEAPTLAALSVAFASAEATLSDFYRTSNDKVLIDAVSPVFDAEGEPLGALLMRSDAREHLFPILDFWPIPSQTSETLLARVEEDSVVFLEDPQFPRHPPQYTRVPLDRFDSPAVEAALGGQGIFEGVDFRGAPVLADVRRVEDSPWILVNKIDAAEVTAQTRVQAGLIASIVALGILFTAALLGYAHRRIQTQIYRRLYRSERKERQAQEEFRTTLYSIGDAVIAADAAGTVTRMNPVAEELTGWTEEEAKGRPLSEVFSILNEENRSAVENPVDLVLREGKIVGLANHTLLISRDGTERPIADSGAPIKNEEGTIVGVVLVFSDQTKEREAERILRETEEAQRAMIDCSPLALYSFDFDGRVIKWNRSAEKIFGWTEAEVVGKPLPNVPDHDRGTFTSLVERIKAGETIHGVEVRRLRKDGTLVDVRVNAAPIRDETGEIVAVMGAVEDITDLKVSKRQLDLQSAALNAAANSIMITDRDGVIEWVNPAFLEMTGYTEEEAIGKTPTDIVRSGQHDEAFYEAMWDTILSGKTWAGEFVNRRKDGSMYPEESVITPVKNDAGEVTHFVAVKQDVSEKKRLQAQFLQSQKMEAVGRLAGGVAHDFNNMLGVILGGIELALMDLPSDHPVGKDLEDVKHAAERSADLTQQLLAFARQQTIAPRILDLNETVGSMLKMLGRLIGEDIDLLWKPGVPISSVRMDPIQIDQILANLAVNARDAIKGVGKMTIETANVAFDEAYCENNPGFVPGEYVQLAVSDNGAGMTPETVSKVFDPFFTTKPSGQGTGLGLATVYGIVKQNEGFINVYSEPGRGTTFKIYFPAVEDALLESERAKAVHPPPRGAETVLVVEDQSALLALVSRMLTQLGYNVLAAESPGEAIDLSERHGDGIQLLMTDVIMPEMSGREIHEQLSRKYPTLKCLYMSGYTSDVIAHHGVLEEGTHFIQKPFSIESLANKVREVLDS